MPEAESHALSELVPGRQESLELRSPVDGCPHLLGPVSANGGLWTRTVQKRHSRKPIVRCHLDEWSAFRPSGRDLAEFFKIPFVALENTDLSASLMFAIQRDYLSKSVGESQQKCDVVCHPSNLPCQHSGKD